MPGTPTAGIRWGFLFMKKEKWKKVVGYESKYLVSSHGKILNLVTGSFVKTSIISGGYEMSLLRFKGKNTSILVHRLVMITFVGPDPDRNEVNHIDGNKLNNRIDNLEWVTRKENMNHFHKNKYNYKAKKEFYDNVNGSAYVKYYLDTYTGIYYNTLSSACRACNLNDRKIKKDVFEFKNHRLIIV